MQVLETEFGNDGYAFWFKLLEILGDTENHYYNLNNARRKRYLFSYCKVSEDKGLDILNTLAELDAIDPELYLYGIIWSDNFTERLKPLYNKRNRVIPQKPDKGVVFGTKTTPNTKFSEVSGTESTQSIVKESKVNTHPSNYILSSQTGTKTQEPEKKMKARGSGENFGKVTSSMINRVLSHYPFGGRIGNQTSNKDAVAEAISRVSREKKISLEETVVYLSERASRFSESDAGQRGTRFTPRANTWFSDECYYQEDESWSLTEPDDSGGLMTWDQAYEAGYSKNQLEVISSEKDEFGRPKVRPKSELITVKARLPHE